LSNNEQYEDVSFSEDLMSVSGRVEEVEVLENEKGIIGELKSKPDVKIN
jgi:hypothetical protein